LNFKSSLILALIGLFLLSALALAGNESGKIAFLTFKFDGEKVTLVNSRIVDGAFKEKVKDFKTGDLRYEVVGADKTTIIQNSIGNPLIKKLEYEDPDNPGQLVSKIVTLPEAVFTVRIDYSQNTDYIRFYQNGKSPAKGDAVMKMIGDIPIGNLGDKTDE